MIEPVVISRGEAREAGVKQYYTGKPCKRGHLDYRMVSTAICLSCQRIYNKKHYHKTLKHRRRGELRDRVRQSNRRYEDANPGRHAAYFSTEKGKEAMRRATQKIRSTPEGKINNRMRSAIRKGISGKKTSTAEEILGYTTEELMAHLEKQFLPGMGWHNMELWHIDHIVPLASFEFDGYDSPDFRAAWALSNLRPVWAIENIKKRDTRTHLI